MTIKEAVDASHPHVQQLIRAGFGETESISAMEKYETPEEANDYLTATRIQRVHPRVTRVEAKIITDEATQYVALNLLRVSVLYCFLYFLRAERMCCFRKTITSYLNLSELGNVLRYLSSHSGMNLFLSIF